jgi:hypothetical protein
MGDFIIFICEWVIPRTGKQVTLIIIISLFSKKLLIKRIKSNWKNGTTIVAAEIVIDGWVMFNCLT